MPTQTVDPALKQHLEELASLAREIGADQVLTVEGANRVVLQAVFTDPYDNHFEQLSSNERDTLFICRVRRRTSDEAKGVRNL